MRPHRSYIALAVLALALALPLRAQEAPAVSGRPPSASHVAAARELLTLLRMEETAVAVGMQAYDQQAAGSPQAAAFRDLVEEWTREVFTSEEARDAFARAYAESLSEEDLLALAKFYRTPLGARVAAAQIGMAAKGAAIGQRLAAERQGVLQERMMARAAELQGADPAE